MKQNQGKSTIYLRIFSALFVTYLILMVSFSIFTLWQEKKVQDLELRTFAFQVNSRVEDILQDNVDSNNKVLDPTKIKKEMAADSPFFNHLGTELALFTGDYQLLFNTKNNWLCSYTEYVEGSTHYVGYGYLDPKKWFTKAEVAELENYLLAQPKAQKVGDLTGYSLNIEGFWLDKEMLIPDKIFVIPMYATSFDEQGEVNSSSGKRQEELVYASNYENTKDLPYFDHGSINPINNDHGNPEKQDELRKMVVSKEKLKETILQVGNISYEKVNSVTYRYYLVLPYQNTIKESDDKNNYSEFWTVLAREVNLLEKCINSLVFVWLSCLIAFLTVAFILANQTYKTYKKKEELEQQRREMTNALAHDLKTPLSIISGYAQNIIENINTEKRGYYADNIQTNVNRMDRIIQEMLELSRFESNLLQLNFENVSLREVGFRVIERYTQLCNEKNIMTNLEGEAVIKADHSLMERVLDNFFVNALENTPAGGEISIRILENTLEFYNSGSHIPEDKLDEIWLPYKKLDMARSNNKGTGLGLSIARTIIDLYNFSYGVKNNDTGVVFWFRFIG